MAVSMSPSLRVSPSSRERVVGSVVVPERRLNPSRAVVSALVAWVRRFRINPGPPPPLAYRAWLARSSGLPGPPAPPSEQGTRPGRLAACAAACAAAPQQQAKPGSRLALHGCAVLASSLASLLPKHTRPALLPLAVRAAFGITAGEKRLDVRSACLELLLGNQRGDNIDDLVLMMPWQLARFIEDGAQLARWASASPLRGAAISE